MATEKVGVDVGLDDPLNGQTVGGGLVEIVGDVASRVDDDGPSRCFIADQVGGVRQTGEVMLGEDHQSSFRGSGAASASGRRSDGLRDHHGRDHPEHAIR